MLVYNVYNNSSKHFKHLFISIIIIPYNNDNKNNKNFIEKLMRHFIWILKIIRFSQYCFVNIDFHNFVIVYFIKKYKYETTKFV